MRKARAAIGVLLASGFMLGIISACTSRSNLFSLHQPGAGIVGFDIIIDVGNGLVTGENGSSDTFTVVLSSQPSADVTIGPIQSMDTGEVTVSPSGLVFTTTDWSTPRTVTVTGVDDAVTDGTVNVVVDLGTATGGEYEGVSGGMVTVQNLDDEAPTSTEVVVLVGDGLITGESLPSDSFQVVLNAAPGADVTVGPIASSDTGEITVSTSSLTFTTANWSTPQTVTVNGVDDFSYDGVQSVQISLGGTASSDPGWDAKVIPPVMAYNIDDDAPKGVTVLAGSQMIVTENGSISRFEVVLDSQPSDNVSIPVSSSDLTEGTVTSSSTLTFTGSNWSSPQPVTVAGVDDFVADGNRNFSITIGPASSADAEYDGIDPPDVTFTTIDDESPGIVVLAGSQMMVHESGTSSSFEVLLSSEPLFDVTIPVSSSDSTEGTASPTSLVFTSGNWSAAQTVTVTGADDAAADGNQPFSIVLGAATSSDSAYDGLDPADVSYLNVDDDAAGITVEIGDGLVTTEGLGSDTFAVVLNSQPAADVTISSITSSDTGEVTVSPTSLTFSTANWSTPQTVTVTGVDDLYYDGVQAVGITVGPAGSVDAAYDTSMNTADLTVYNIDDEAYPEVIVLQKPGGFVTSENGASARIQVVLNQPPAANVTLGTIASSDPGEGTASPSSLTFTPTDWNVPHVVTVTGVDDGTADADQPYSIDLGTASSTDPGWSGISPADVAVTNLAFSTIPDFTLVNTSGSVASISGSGTPIAFREVDPYDGYTAEDEGYEYVPIGFAFYYLGMPHFQVTAYTNGFASLSPYHNPANTFANEFLFQDTVDAGFFVNILAPWWDDLDMAPLGGAAYYQTTGTAPNRVFTLEWQKAKIAVPVGSDDFYSFQIKLYEGSNVVEFHYIHGDNADGSNNETTASVGIKDEVGGDGHAMDGLDGTTSGFSATNYQRKAADFPADGSIIVFTP